MRFVCSIDGRRSRWLQVVLTIQGDDGVPRVVDGRRLSGKASAAAVRTIFEEWESDGGLGVELIVCNCSDALSSELVEGLQALAPLEWVEEADLAEVLAAWDELMPRAGWLRGTLMALLAGVPQPLPEDWRWGGIGHHWLETWFSSHLAEFEQRSTRNVDRDPARLEDVPF